MAGSHNRTGPPTPPVATIGPRGGPTVVGVEYRDCGGRPPRATTIAATSILGDRCGSGTRTHCRFVCSGGHRCGHSRRLHVSDSVWRTGWPGRARPLSRFNQRSTTFSAFDELGDRGCPQASRECARLTEDRRLHGSEGPALQRDEVGFCRGQVTSRTSACATSTRPAGVIATVLPRLRSNGTPASRSRTASCCQTAGRASRWQWRRLFRGGQLAKQRNAANIDHEEFILDHQKRVTGPYRPKGSAFLQG